MASDMIVMGNTLYIQARFPGIDAELFKLDPDDAALKVRTSSNLVKRGDFRLSRSPEVSGEEGDLIFTYPNAFTNTFSLGLTSPDDDPMSLWVRTMDGQIVLQGIVLFRTMCTP